MARCAHRCACCANAVTYAAWDTYVVAEARRNLAAKGPQALHLLDALLADLEVALVATQATKSAKLQSARGGTRTRNFRARKSVLKTATSTSFATRACKKVERFAIHAAPALVQLGPFHFEPACTDARSLRVRLAVQAGDHPPHD